MTDKSLDLLILGMDNRYYESPLGKAQTLIGSLAIIFTLISFANQYSIGKEANPYGLIVTMLGLGFFLKAKISVIKKGKYVSFGCDHMNQRNSWFYSLGWFLMLSGYFLSFG